MKLPRPPHIEAIIELQASFVLVAYVKMRPSMSPTMQLVWDFLVVVLLLAKGFFAHIRGRLLDRLMHYWQKKELALDDD